MINYFNINRTPQSLSRAAPRSSTRSITPVGFEGAASTITRRHLTAGLRVKQLHVKARARATSLCVYVRALARACECAACGAAVIRPIGGTVALQWDGVSRAAGAGADGWHAVPAELCRMRAAATRTHRIASTTCASRGRVRVQPASLSTRKLGINSEGRAECVSSSSSSSWELVLVRSSPRPHPEPSGRFEFGSGAGDVKALPSPGSRGNGTLQTLEVGTVLLSCTFGDKPARYFMCCMVEEPRHVCHVALFFCLYFILVDHTFETLRIE